MADSPESKNELVLNFSAYDPAIVGAALTVASQLTLHQYGDDSKVEKMLPNHIVWTAAAILDEMGPTALKKSANL